MRRRTELSRLLVAVAVAPALVISVSLLSGETAAAASVCSDGGPGTVLLYGTAWLGGQGVDVCSNGGSSANDYGRHYTNGIYDGEMWQCVELVDRLYLTRGWISSTWWGNGDQLYANAPGNLSREPQGSISHISPGDVISFEYPNGGHAAVVNSVAGSTIGLINQNAQQVNSQGTLSGGTLTMSGWAGYSIIGVIHAPGSGAGIADGTFVGIAGHPEIYRVAGGAPVYVSSWDAVGGPQPVTAISQSQFDALRPYPADGTFVNTNAGYVYRFAGGAPLYVSTWSAVGGSQPSIRVDQAAIDNAGGAPPWNHVHSYPSDGTFVGTSAGYVYRFAGGAPIYVTSWDNVGGPQPTTGIDQAAIDNADGGTPWNHVRRYPADGTAVWDSANDAGHGTGYVFVGGAALPTTQWAFVGSPAAPTAVDGAALENYSTSEPWHHVRRYPVDGAAVFDNSNDTQRGTGYVFAGGAPIAATSWAAVGNPSPVTAVDGAALATYADAGVWSHVRAVPTNGEFLRTSASKVYRVAGGAPILVTDWSAFGGTQPAALVDQAAVDRATEPVFHLRTVPTDGTVVEGLPSQQYSEFSAGCRSVSTPVAGAIGENDAAINAYSACVTPSPSPSPAPSPSSTPPGGDTTAPTVSLRALPHMTIATSVPLTWSGADPGSGVASYDVRYRRSRFSSGFGAWSYPSSWQATTSTSRPLSLARGYDYCVQVRARDGAGNTSGWSAARCVARAFDDRALLAHGAWSRRNGAAYYAGTVTTARSKGARLTLRPVQADRLALLATRCAGCGSVAIYVGSRLVGKVNLSSLHTHNRQLIALPEFSYCSGTVTIRTLTAKPVLIDGLATSRS